MNGISTTYALIFPSSQATSQTLIYDPTNENWTYNLPVQQGNQILTLGSGEGNLIWTPITGYLHLENIKVEDILEYIIMDNMEVEMKNDS